MKARAAVLSVLAAVALAGCIPQAGSRGEDWPWGRTVRGLQSRIVFEKHAYRPGEPIACWVEVRNVSDKPVPYDGRVSALVRVVGPDAHEPPRIHGPREFMSQALASDGGYGERKEPPRYEYPALAPSMVVRRDQYRFDGPYYMGQAGRYRFRWAGASPLPPVEAAGLARDFFGEEPGESKPGRTVPPEVRALPPAAEAEIEVLPAPGGLPPGDLVGRLLRVMPPGWCVCEPPWLFQRGGPPGYKRGSGSFLCLLDSPVPNSMMNLALIGVWAMAGAAERDPKATGRPAEYLGAGKLGHVYVDLASEDFGGPLPRWLHAAHDIAAALEVENPPPKPDGPDWGRLLCRMLSECERRPVRWRSPSQGLGSLRASGKVARGDPDLVRLEFCSNLAPPTPSAPRARKDPASPYHDVLFSVRPTRSAERPSAWDKAIAWRTPAGGTGEVCWRIASDDVAFTRALRAIFEREVRGFLREQRREGSLLDRPQ